MRGKNCPRIFNCIMCVVRGSAVVTVCNNAQNEALLCYTCFVAI